MNSLLWPIFEHTHEKKTSSQTMRSKTISPCTKRKHTNVGWLLSFDSIFKINPWLLQIVQLRWNLCESHLHMQNDTKTHNNRIRRATEIIVCFYFLLFTLFSGVLRALQWTLSCVICCLEQLLCAFYTVRCSK